MKKSIQKPKRRAKTKILTPRKSGPGSLLRDLRGLIVAAREQVARAVDSGLVILHENRAACSGRRFGPEN